MWDKRYGEAGYVYGTEPNDFLKSIIGKIPAGRVLCIGAGEGRNAVHLASRGYQVTAVDASRVGLEKARALADKHGVEIETIVADLNTFDFGTGKWNGIVSIFCHLSPEIRRTVYRKCVAGLAPEGVLVLEGFTPEQLKYKSGGPSNRQMLLTLAELKNELDGLEFEIGREVERELAEGRYHNGTAAVVQVLGKNVRL